MSHNIQPMSEYWLITITVAVPEELATTGEVFDAINGMMDANWEWVHDWQLKQEEPVKKWSDAYDPKEGELFSGT